MNTEALVQMSRKGDKDALVQLIMAQKDEEIMLEKHLSKLNLKYQEVIKLRYYLDLDYQSIADVIQIPVGTVKSRISTGLKKLKESLGGDDLEASGRYVE
ncbi:MAG: sigma-70 family RNA polymerase sigma factor [Bacillota bacterium]|nr:sigma-70 family RNA polymerase sigma factor [Bacillota bacterium]